MIGYIYILKNSRKFWIHKVGITNKTVKERAANIDKSMRGDIRIVYVIPSFFPYEVEQTVHGVYDIFGLRRVQKTGSGRTEWVLSVTHISFLLVWFFNIAYTLLPILLGYVAMDIYQNYIF